MSAGGVFGDPRLEHHCRAVSELARYELSEHDLGAEREQLHRWCVADAKAAMRAVAAEVVRARIEGAKQFKLEAAKFVERFPALSRMLPSGVVLTDGEFAITFKRDEYEKLKSALAR